MTREEEKNHQSFVYIIKQCDTSEVPDWEDVELGFQAGMEYADEHPIHYDGQAMLHVLHKGVEQGKKEMLDRVIEWLDNNLCCYIGAQNFTIEHDRLNKDLRKDMEG